MILFFSFLNYKKYSSIPIKKFSRIWIGWIKFWWNLSFQTRGNSFPFFFCQKGYQLTVCKYINYCHPQMEVMTAQISWTCVLKESNLRWVLPDKALSNCFSFQSNLLRLMLSNTLWLSNKIKVFFIYAKISKQLCFSSCSCIARIWDAVLDHYTHHHVNEAKKGTKIAFPEELKASDISRLMSYSNELQIYFDLFFL